MAEASATWTDERLDRLKKLWSEGLSASQIAAELGVTRNAVLGKSHRLGLVRNPSAKADSPHPLKPSRPLPPTSTTEPFMKHGPKTVTDMGSCQPAAQPSAEPPQVEAVSPQPEGVTIMELRESMCRWPNGDPTRPEFRYCGAGAIEGLPYCSHHARIAYQPSADRKRLRA
jgi:GcrA cell cycle regulator